MKWHIKLVKTAGSSAKCRIKELEFVFWDLRESEDTIRKFLGAQVPILKSLLGPRLPNGFQDFRLEFLDFDYNGSKYLSLNFLKHLEDLKYLRLRLAHFTDPISNMISELKNLKYLELRVKHYRYVIQTLMKHEKKMEDVYIVIKSHEPNGFPLFPLEKKPGGTKWLKIVDFFA